MAEPKSLFAELQSRDPSLLKLLEEVNRVFGKTKREIRLNEVKQEVSQ